MTDLRVGLFYYKERSGNVVQRKLPTINSAHGTETRNIINEIIKAINDRGLEILSESAFLNWLNKNGVKHLGEWDNTKEYDRLSVVLHEGDSYTSKKIVPVGIDILNEEFWVLTGNYDAQLDSFKTDTNNELNKKVSKGELFINVMDYGAVGDGINNDNDAILNAVNSGTLGTTYIFPKGDYLINDLELHFPDESQIIFAGRFIVSDDVVQFGLRIGKHSSRLNRIDIKGLKIHKKTTEVNGNIIGLSLMNMYGSVIDVRHVRGFGYGLLLEAEGHGNVYNHFHLGLINDNRKNLFMKIGTGGWVNENTFHGGWFTWSSSLSNVYGEGFSHIEIPKNEQYPVNNNLFLKPSFEGGNTESHALKIDGPDNTVIQGRYETSSIVEILGNNNVLMYGYGLFTANVIDNGARNKIFDRNKIVLKGGTIDESVMTFKPTSGTAKALSVLNLNDEEVFTVDGLGHTDVNSLKVRDIIAKRTLSGGVIDPTTQSPSNTLQIKNEDGSVIGYVPIYKPE